MIKTFLTLPEGTQDNSKVILRLLFTQLLGSAASLSAICKVLQTSFVTGVALNK